MKRITALLLAAVFAPALSALADNPHDGKNDNTKPSKGRISAGEAKPAPARQPVIINMTHPSSGGHNQNFPSQRPAPQPQNNPQPSYGKLNWSSPAFTRPEPKTPAQNFTTPRQTVRPDVKRFEAPGLKAAVAVHHHPYTPGYVRKKLQKIGVNTEPALITDRGQMIHTNKAHSTIHFPQNGPGHTVLNANVVSPRHFNDPIVRNHMALVGTPDWQAKVTSFNSTETRRNYYYWHRDNSFNYCHYIDGDGYQWWGWYVGDQFFWNRYYEGRWWWYDNDYDRWCFWHDGFWWWQDPYHVGDIYCYNDDNYIPCNSALDQEVVTAPADQTYQVYNAPDNSCQIKVMSGTQDAFLYDTDAEDVDSARQPIYLASGVESVMFSDTRNGRPLEIVLKLNDGTFDMFDDDGNSYGPGTFDEDQNASSDTGDATDNPPSDTTN